MKILGISGLYHDSAAAFVCDSEIVAAVQEERFTRIKHDNSIPFNTINFCLKEANIQMYEADAVIYYDQPLLTLDRYFHNVAALGKESEYNFKERLDDIVFSRLAIDRHFREHYVLIGRGNELLTLEHHLSHGASAFYPSRCSKYYQIFCRKIIK